MIIPSLTADTIAKGGLKEVLPEYYELKKSTENNVWHKNQNVFDHVVAVYRGLETILKDPKIQRYLSARIGGFSREEILKVATIFHDIAKVQTLIIDKTGLTRCPGHELIGSYYARTKGKKFGFSGKNIDALERIVRYHGLVHDLLTLIENHGKSNEYFVLFKNTAGDVYIELFLLANADMLGCDLPSVNPKEFIRRRELLTNEIHRSL